MAYRGTPQEQYDRQAAPRRRREAMARALRAMTIEDLVRADRQLWASIVRRNAGRAMRRRYIADYWTTNTRRLICEELRNRERVLPRR